MLDLVSEIKTSLLKRRSVHIENTVFRLHWLVTATLLVIFSMVLTARQYVGQPIDCLLETNSIQASMINTYCWISQTFLVPDAINKELGVDVPHPGVLNSHTRTPEAPNGFEKKYYPYYQWICFVLFVQGVTFYLPHWMWKISEGGLMKSLAKDVHFAVISEEERITKSKLLSEYLLRHFHFFSSYAYRYIFYECLCLLNLVVQFLLTDLLFDGQFMWFGVEVLKQTELVRRFSASLWAPLNDSPNPVNPFTLIFPRMTKCFFYYYGSSGDVQKKDALCLLPLNVFNEKIYLFLWYWFVFLFILSSLTALIRLLMLFVTPLRARILRVRCRVAPIKYMKHICSKGNFGDFFILYQLCQNIDPVVMEEVLYEIGKELTRKDHCYSNGFGGQSVRHHSHQASAPLHHHHSSLSHSFRTLARSGSLDQLTPSKARKLHS